MLSIRGITRSSTNFVRSNCVVMDVDNDHSDDPAEWITPESLEEEYADIRFAITFSRHHMKQKEGKGPRPRMHVYFEISEYTDAEKYAALKRISARYIPFMMTMPWTQAASFTAASPNRLSGMTVRILSKAW